jgi:hypothetical protein
MVDYKLCDHILWNFLGGWLLNKTFYMRFFCSPMIYAWFKRIDLKLIENFKKFFCNLRGIYIFLFNLSFRLIIKLIRIKLPMCSLFSLKRIRFTFKIFTYLFTNTCSCCNLIRKIVSSKKL